MRATPNLETLHLNLHFQPERAHARKTRIETHGKITPQHLQHHRHNQRRRRRWRSSGRDADVETPTPRVSLHGQTCGKRVWQMTASSTPTVGCPQKKGHTCSLISSGSSPQFPTVGASALRLVIGCCPFQASASRTPHHTFADILRSLATAVVLVLQALVCGRFSLAARSAFCEPRG